MMIFDYDDDDDDDGGNGGDGGGDDDGDENGCICGGCYQSTVHACERGMCYLRSNKKDESVCNINYSW